MLEPEKWAHESIPVLGPQGDRRELASQKNRKTEKTKRAFVKVKRKSSDGGFYLIFGIISKLRRSKGITLEKLSYEMGISKGNLSDIENGKKDPRFSTFVAIAEGFEISVPTLLKSL